MAFDRFQSAASIAPRFAASLDALVPPYPREDVDSWPAWMKPRTPLQVMELFLLALIMQDIGWIDYDFFGRPERKRPVSNLRWSGSRNSITVQYHTEFGDGSECDQKFQIMRADDDGFAFHTDGGWRPIEVIYMMLTNHGDHSDHKVSFYLKYAQINDVIKEARQRGFSDH